MAAICFLSIVVKFRQTFFPSMLSKFGNLFYCFCCRIWAPNEHFSNFYEPGSESQGKPKGNQGRQTPLLEIWPWADQGPSPGQSVFSNFYWPCSCSCEFLAKPKGNAMAWQARIANLKITGKRLPNFCFFFCWGRHNHFLKFPGSN